MKIVITDCDHDSIDIETSAIEEAGIGWSFSQASTEEEVIAAAADADVLMVQYAPITALVLDALPKVRAISRYGVGVDNIDVDAATGRGIPVMNVPDYGTEEVADHALSLALSAFRGVTTLDRLMRKNIFDIASIRPVSRISQSTFGVIGLGAIGRVVASKASAFGFRVVGYDPFINEGTELQGVDSVVRLERLVHEADVISLHIPLTSETEHIVDESFLSKMKETAVLVNTCRGGVVDTGALIEALEGKKIRAAGLDVFEEEPLPCDSPLLALDNVVLTPHAAWYSEQARFDMKIKTAEHAIAAALGSRLTSVVNPAVLIDTNSSNE